LDALKSIPFDLFEPKLYIGLALGVVRLRRILTIVAKEYIERGEHEHDLCTSAPATRSLS